MSTMEASNLARVNTRVGRDARRAAGYNALVALLRNVTVTLEMIKWEHSVFALPFALAGAMLAAGGLPSTRQLVWIIVAMVAARSAAMAFNRLADAAIDGANPRTRARALPAGTLSRQFVAAFVVVFGGIFVLAAAQLNRLTLLLSPVALAVVLLYSYTKRFTRWSHLVLGFALGIAPAAAWIAIRASLDSRILLLTGAVTFWVGGFDVLYACQDYGFHLLMLALLAALVYAFHLGPFAMAGVVAVALLLGYEHSLVRTDDLSKLDAAFFTMNGVISVVFFVFVAADLLWR